MAHFRPLARYPCMARPWLWGVILGLCVGSGVVLVSSLRYGFSLPLLVLGLVLAIVFGGMAVMGALVRRAGVE